MKKLLGLLGSIGMTATTATAVVSCGGETSKLDVEKIRAKVEAHDGTTKEAIKANIHREIIKIAPRAVLDRDYEVLGLRGSANTGEITVKAKSTSVRLKGEFKFHIVKRTTINGLKIQTNLGGLNDKTDSSIKAAFIVKNPQFKGLTVNHLRIVASTNNEATIEILSDTTTHKGAVDVSFSIKQLLGNVAGLSLALGSMNHNEPEAILDKFIQINQDKNLFKEDLEIVGNPTAIGAEIRVKASSPIYQGVVNITFAIKKMLNAIPLDKRDLGTIVKQTNESDNAAIARVLNVNNPNLDLTVNDFTWIGTAYGLTIIATPTSPNFQGSVDCTLTNTIYRSLSATTNKWHHQFGDTAEIGSGSGFYVRVSEITHLGWDATGKALQVHDEVTKVPNYINPKITSLEGLFEDAVLFNGDISKWDVSKVTNMKKMFKRALLFNGDISKWDVSKVTNMDDMFNNAAEFNGDISKWDVSKVTSMARMFYRTAEFNGDISKWDVSKVTSMHAMFDRSHKFNQDISKWDVSKVTNMEWMFYDAYQFNQDISKWDVSEVTSMQAMFENTHKFNQDISKWDISKVSNMKKMFNNAQAFSQDISKWNVARVTNSVNFANKLTSAWPTNFRPVFK
ncbi:BspA family leucine-rich repeat surface protein [Williamsoniiplasma luminosum]|nr:BspA family leucine-rich repeat surface protein [Williamsoniiplasma luminosum]